MAKSWERPWSIEEIVENAPKWTLAGDVALLKHLEDFSEKLFAKAEDTNDNLNKLLDDLNESSIKVDLVKNEFLGLQNTQFIESRVYEDDETLETAKEEKVEKKKENENDTKEAMKRAVLDGLDILDKYYDRISVPASDSEDEEAESYVLRMKDPYINRPLPYLIGSKEWHEKWHVGLVASSSEDEEEQVEEKYSDTDSESNLPVIDRRTISTSDSGTDISNRVEKPVASSTFNDTVASTDSEEYNNSIPSKPPISNLSFAEQLAARLGNVATEDQPVPVNRNPIQKPTVQTRIMGDILSDEPPPLDDSEDGLFSGKSGQGMFSGGDSLFDGSDDDTDYFSGRKVNTKTKKPAECTVPNLFDDNEEEGMFTQKTEEKTNQPNNTNRGLFSEEESDDDLFSASNYRPPPSYMKSTTDTIIPFIPDEPPELIPKTKHQDTSRNVQSAQSSASEVSEKSSTSNTESGDLETDNRLLINAKQKPKKVGLFDDPGDLFKDDIFSDAGLFSTTIVQKEVKQKKKLKLFDDEDDDIFASKKLSPKDGTNSKSHNGKQSDGEARDKILSSNCSDRKTNSTKEDSILFSNKDKQTGPSDPASNTNDETSNSKLFGSDEDLFKSKNLFNSTAQDNKKANSGLFSSSGKLFDSPDADLFSDTKGGLFDSPGKTNQKESNTNNKIIQEKTRDLFPSSQKTSLYQDQHVASSSASIPVANTSSTSKGDIFSSSPKVENPLSSSPEILFPTNTSQKKVSSKEAADFSSKESRSMFDDDDDGWDKPPLDSSAKSSSRNLFDEDSSDDDMFSSRPPLKKLLEKKALKSEAKSVHGILEDKEPPLKKLPEKKALQSEAKSVHGLSEDKEPPLKELPEEKALQSEAKSVHGLLEDKEPPLKELPEKKALQSEAKSVHGLLEDKEGSNTTLQLSHAKFNDNSLREESHLLQEDNTVAVVGNVHGSHGKLEEQPVVVVEKLEENSLKISQEEELLESEGLPESLQAGDVKQEKELTKSESKLDKTTEAISEEQKKPPIMSKKPTSTIEKKKPVIQKEKPPIASSKPVIKSVEPEIDSTIANENSEPQEIKESVPPFSLFNDSPPDIDWDTKSETNLFDDEDMFDDIPVSSQKASIFDHEPPSLESYDKSKKLLFNDDAPGANRVMNLFDDGPPSLDFLVRSPRKGDLFQEGPPSLDIMGNSCIFDDESSSYRSRSLGNHEDVPDFKSKTGISGSEFDSHTRSKSDATKGTGSDREDILVKPKAIAEKMDVKKYDFLKKLDANPDDVPEKKRDSPGKIKHNLNINVNALMPGASMPRKKDTASTLSKSRSLEEKQESVESENVTSIQHTQSCKDVSAMQEQVEQISNDKDVETLHSITKNRARIQTKRKPSTRRARQASIKKKDEKVNNTNDTDDRNENSPTDAILDNAGFSTHNNNLDDTQTVNTKDQNQNDKPDTIVTEKRTARAVDDVMNTSLFDDPIIQKQKADESNNSSLFDDPIIEKQKADESKNSSLFDAVDSDSDIFADKKQAVKGKSKLSLFDDVDDGDDLFSARETRKQACDDPGGVLFKDDVDIFAPKKVTGKKGSLFEDLSGDEDIFGSGTATKKNTGKSIGNSEKRPTRNRNLLKKSEETRVVHDPLDAMSNNFND